MHPLIVDLDGTLIQTDLLESANQFVLAQPWQSSSVVAQPTMRLY
ncbi:MAG: hypothetical protein WA012_12210 [Rhodoferax sp.]|jgi:hypothetical protein